MIEIRNPVNIGIDVGQITDPTAIAVVEVSQKHDGRWRFGERIPVRVSETGQLGGKDGARQLQGPRLDAPSPEGSGGETLRETSRPGGLRPESLAARNTTSGHGSSLRIRSQRRQRDPRSHAGSPLKWFPDSRLWGREDSNLRFLIRGFLCGLATTNSGSAA